MSLKQRFFVQFSKPTGDLGRFVGWLMAIKNKERSRWTIQKLDFKPTDQILEIGYGSGATLSKIASQLTTGFIAGIDHAEVMFQQAAKKTRMYVREKVKLQCGTLSGLRYPNDHFDIIFGSNVHFFWTEPVQEFRKLYFLLKPGGRLAMVFQPRWAKSEEAVKDIAEKTKRHYESAGFNNVKIEFKAMKPVTCIYTGGQK